MERTRNRFTGRKLREVGAAGGSQRTQLPPELVATDSVGRHIGFGVHGDSATSHGLCFPGTQMISTGPFSPIEGPLPW